MRTLEGVLNLEPAYFGQDVPCVCCIILRGGPFLPGFLQAGQRSPVSPTWPVGTQTNEHGDLAQIKGEGPTV